MINYNLVTWGGTPSDFRKEERTGLSCCVLPRLPKGGQRRFEVTPHRLSDLSGGDS